MLKKIFASIIVVSSLAVVGCQSVPQDKNHQDSLTALQNTTWVATKINNAVVVHSTLDPNRATLMFDAASKRVTGSDGCNRISGSYQASNKTLSFDQMISTRMACLNNANIDTLFNQALTQVTHYKVEKRMLKLYNKQNQVVLEFESVIQPR